MNVGWLFLHGSIDPFPKDKMNVGWLSCNILQSSPQLICCLYLQKHMLTSANTTMVMELDYYLPVPKYACIVYAGCMSQWNLILGKVTQWDRKHILWQLMWLVKWKLEKMG